MKSINGEYVSMKMYDDNGNPYCPVCGKVFTQVNNAYRCVRKVHGIKVRSQRSPNEIVIMEDHAEIILYDRHGFETSRAIIDNQDVDIVTGFKWYLRWQKNGPDYVRSSNGIALHQLIMGDVPDNFDDIDHIDRDTLNNKRSNLRFATRSIQSTNCRKKKRRKDIPHSEIIGVIWRDDSKVWTVLVKRKKYGCYKSKSDAEKRCIEIRRIMNLPIH